FPGGEPAHNMRIGIDASQGALSQVALVRPDGSKIYFPATHGKRHAVGAGGGARVMHLDGIGTDWQMIHALIEGIASGGTQGLRIEKFFGFADVDEDFLYFRFDANISADSPVAVDDHYTRPSGAGLTVPAPGVLSND